MTRSHARRRAILSGSMASLLIAAALPAQAVNIPEGGAVTPDSSTLIHLRVTSTCDGLPMDELQVTMPESVSNPVPEAVPGWDVTIEPDPDDAAAAEEDTDDETDEDADEMEPTVVRWSGGPLEDGRLLEFGVRARFPDEEGEVLTFPVVQRCADVEVESAPTVTLAKRYGNKDIADIDAEVGQLRAEVDVLRADVDQLQEQVGDVNVVNLRSRVSDTERAIEDLDERVSALEGDGTEPTPEPEPVE